MTPVLGKTARLQMSFLFFPFKQDSAASSPVKDSNWDEEAHRVISKLVNSLQTSSILSDKRDILKNMHGYSKKFPSILASFGFDCYFELFSSDVQDSQIIGLALQTILSLIRASEDTLNNFLKFLQTRTGTFVQIFVSFEHDQLVCDYLMQILSALTEKNQTGTISVIDDSLQQIVDKLCLFLRGENDILFVEAANLLAKWSCSSQKSKQLLVVRANIHLFIGDFLEKSSINRVRYETVYLLELLEAVLNENWVFLNSTDCVNFLHKLCGIFLRELNEHQKAATQNWSSSVVKNYSILLKIFQNLLANSDVCLKSDDNAESGHVKFQATLASLLEPLANLALQFSWMSQVLCINSLAVIALTVKENENNARSLEKIVVRSVTSATPTQFLLTLANLILNEKSAVFSVQLKVASLLVMNCYFLNNKDLQLATISTLIPTPEGTELTHGKLPLANETVGSLLLKALFDFSTQNDSEEQTTQDTEPIDTREILQKNQQQLQCTEIASKPFLASLLLSFIIHGNPLATQKASSFPVTVDFLHEFNTENSDNPANIPSSSSATNSSHAVLADGSFLNFPSHNPSAANSHRTLHTDNENRTEDPGEVREFPSHAPPLVPTIPQNIFLALSNLSDDELPESTRIGYTWLLCELLNNNSPLASQLLSDFNLTAYLRQNQSDWNCCLFATLLNTCWSEGDKCTRLISNVCTTSHKPFQRTFRHLSRLDISAYLPRALPDTFSLSWLLNYFDWPIADLLSSLSDAERILLGYRPIKSELEAKLARYEIDSAALKSNLESTLHNKNALLKRVTELEDEQQQFLERIGALEEQIIRLKKNAKMSDILNI